MIEPSGVAMDVLTAVAQVGWGTNYLRQWMLDNVLSLLEMTASSHRWRTAK